LKVFVSREFILYSAIFCVTTYPIIDYIFAAGHFSNLNRVNMTDGKSKDSHLPPTDSGMAKEEFIRVGTTLYKIVEQPKLDGGYIKKRIAWNNETLR
jgi:hypothetical protein